MFFDDELAPPQRYHEEDAEPSTEQRSGKIRQNVNSYPNPERSARDGCEHDASGSDSPADPVACTNIVSRC